MALHEDEAEAGRAVMKALTLVPAHLRTAVLNETVARDARQSIDEAFADIYRDAETMIPKSVAELEDPKHYAAACIMYMKYENKTRAKRDMLMHVGKIFGHDKRTIDIQDKSSYRDVLITLRDQFKPMIDGLVTARTIEPDASR